MAIRKRPDDEAMFEFWLSLGDERSFVAVAKHFGLDKSGVTRVAQRGRWLERLNADIEPQVARKVAEKIVENLADLRVAQAKLGQELVDRGMEVLRSRPVLDTRDAIQVVKLGADLQARAMEQPSKRVSVEHTLRERLVPVTPPPKALEGPKPRITVEFQELDEMLEKGEG